MARVALLRGVNVGGSRTFRPTELVRQLSHLDLVSIGAAGTFVVRKSVTNEQLRTEIANTLPFAAEIMICQGGDILRLMARKPFGTQPARSDIVRFVSLLAKSPRSMPSLPMLFPAKGRWLVKILGRDRRFVFGVYRRDMKALRYLGEFDRAIGVSSTTRNWNTVNAIAKVLRKETA